MGARRQQEDSSRTWSEFVDRYRRYRTLPFWGTKTFRPDERGVLSPGQLASMRRQGEAGAERVAEAISRLKRDPSFPSTPQELDQPYLVRIRQHRLLPQRLQASLFAALIFDRGGYTCCYCGRNADAM
jgi:hypothetical protein